MDSLSALGAFVRAAEALSFTEAGRQMRLSSSAIGKAVSRLEERNGVRLFNRNTRSITLTHEGKLFLESCRRILSEIEWVELELAQAKTAPKGKLRACLPLIAMQAMPLLSQFMRRFPDIDLDIDFSDQSVDLIEGGYDVAVRSGDATDSRLMSRSLGSYRLELVGSPKYFREAGFPTDPADLTNHRCLHRKSPVDGRIERWPFMKSYGGDLALPVTATVSAVAPLISLAELGFGIACLPDFAIEQQIADGSLVRVLGNWADHTEVYRVMWPSNRHLSPKLRAFIDFLVDERFPRATLSGERNVQDQWISPAAASQFPLRQDSVRPIRLLA